MKMMACACAECLLARMVNAIGERVINCLPKSPEVCCANTLLFINQNCSCCSPIFGVLKIDATNFVVVGFDGAASAIVFGVATNKPYGGGRFNAHRLLQ